jgi:hypothetical protein
MYKLLNILFLLLIFLFCLTIYKYYFSSKNIKLKNFNRMNINQIINDKIYNLPILADDTNNVIEFNDSFSEKNDIDKQRSFWDLLKSK